MVIDIPELRHYIAQYLDFDTLKAFSVVCKAWHLDAQTILWKRFDCQVPQKCSASPEEYAFWLDAIRKNAISFRYICYVEDKEPIAPEIRDILLGQCHSLDSIKMNISSRHFQGPVCGWEGTLRPLIGQNRVTLRYLELRWNDNRPTSILPSLLASLPRLQFLVLFADTMMMEDVFSILDGFPSSLESFGLNATLTRSNKLDQGDSVNNPDYSSLLSNARPLQLKYLRLLCSGHRGTVEEILSRLAVHSLQDFRMEAACCLQITPSVRDALWRLTSLHLEDSQFRMGDERALLGILEAIHPHQLRQVRVYLMAAEGIAKLIEKQHQSLEDLTVKFEQYQTGALDDILATCGRLKSLTLLGWPFVNIGTLIDPQKPWVCTDLEDFEGDFGLALPIEPHVTGSLVSSVNATVIEEQFMRRLGRLTNLRCVMQRDRCGDIVFDPATGDLMDKRSMKWSLASGLEHLHGLVNLQTFTVLGQDRRKWIGVPEMMFIKQHWHSLKEMVCTDVGEIAVQEWLTAEWPELKASKE
ncbi:MAG: hypothetical protein J3Q66DRAFT_406812 [Benniella sp.]|nr:MAG: hypothetical protein J3Q66DRAFT_406812 [Benniella sp.]